jgi:hypothetical protein
VIGFFSRKRVRAVFDDNNIPRLNAAGCNSLVDFSRAAKVIVSASPKSSAAFPPRLSPPHRANFFRPTSFCVRVLSLPYGDALEIDPALKRIREIGLPSDGCDCLLHDPAYVKVRLASESLQPVA